MVGNKRSLVVLVALGATLLGALPASGLKLPGGVIGSTTAAAVPAPAAPAAATFVGGGAAAVEVATTVTDTSAPGSAPVVGGFVSFPAVILPPTGGNFEDEASVSQPSPDVKIDIGRVTTRGNLAGTPYAASTASLVGVHVGRLSPIFGATDLGLVRSECLWTIDGVSAKTEIVRVNRNGEIITPWPNTRVDIPGLGYAVLNEQVRQTLPDGREVISVTAVRVYLDYLVGPARHTTTIGLAFSSCDPLRIPSLTGITQGLQQ